MPLEIVHTEKRLLEKVAQGDENAFRELFHQYRNRIYTLAYRYTRSVSSAEEVVQDIFLRIWLRRNTLPGVIDFEAYLYVVTRNEVYRVLKHIARQRLVASPEDDQMPPSHCDTDQNLLCKDYTRVLQKAVEKLPSRQRQVYQYIKENKLNRNQVALMLNLNPETVKTHLAQAVRNVRAYCLAHMDLLPALFLLALCEGHELFSGLF